MSNLIEDRKKNSPIILELLLPNMNPVQTRTLFFLIKFNHIFSFIIIKFIFYVDTKDMPMKIQILNDFFFQIQLC